MTLFEKIGKLPAWKAALALVFIVIFVVFAIEKIFLSRVFNVMDKTVSLFEQQEREDREDFLAERKADDARHLAEKKEAEEASIREAENKKQAAQAEYCPKYFQIKRAEAYLEKHKNDPKNDIAEMLEREEKSNEAEYGVQKSRLVLDVEKAIADKTFDPALCHESDPA